jgi:hypothetical protein
VALQAVSGIIPLELEYLHHGVWRKSFPDTFGWSKLLAQFNPVSWDERRWMAGKI